MRKYITFITFALVLCCQKPDIQSTEACQYQPEADYSNHPKAAQFSEILLKYKRKGLPGITAMMEDEDGIWVGYTGYADLKNKVEFLPCQPSKAASVTKLMVATAGFILQEDGLWSLDDRISDYIDKDIIDNIEGADKVTIRNCMQHTTGFYDIITDSEFYLSVLNNPNKHWKAEELITFAYNKEGAFAPNTAAKYSNTNILLVSMAMDKVLGYSHARALRERLWTPLEMNDTYYQSRESLPNNIAQGYYDLYNDGSILNVSNIITGSGNGYGGVFSTVFDLRKFMRALYFDKTLISQASLDEMFTFINEDEKRDIGVGILRSFKHMSVEPGVGHTGRDLGYSADMFVFPTANDRLMIFFVNYGTDGDTPLRQVFWDFEEDMIKALIE
jgi:D-alanyl-D-alanine carboxypeptidase